MRTTGSVGRPWKTKHLQDHCEKLKFSSENAVEARFLAALYRVIAFGGRIVVEPWVGEAAGEIFLADPPRRCPGCKSIAVYPRTNDGAREAYCLKCGAVVGLDQTRPAKVEEAEAGKPSAAELGEIGHAAYCRALGEIRSGQQTPATPEELREAHVQGAMAIVAALRAGDKDRRATEGPAS
jgi:hypothetical protein